MTADQYREAVQEARDALDRDGNARKYNTRIAQLREAVRQAASEATQPAQTDPEAWVWE
jgi:hypothetical protein